MSSRIWRVALAIFTIAFGVPSVAQAGCRLTQDGDDATIAVSGRSMLIHLPRGHDPASPAPLVFLLHGSGGTGAAMLKDSKLAEAADRHGFIVAAPDGGIPVENGFVWNIPGVPTVTGKIPDSGDADDVAYIGAAIDQLVQQGCVDRVRVYATGLSGGGRMTSWLGCVSADRFAAIAPVVGLRAGNPSRENPNQPDPQTCKPSHPMPVMAFAGDKDTTNPIQGGGAGYWQYTMHAAEQRWAQLNGCRKPPATQWVRPDVYEERYSGCRNNADVAGRITVGGGHAWVADNDVMLTFFSRHRRN